MEIVCPHCGETIDRVEVFYEGELYDIVKFDEGYKEKGFIVLEPDQDPEHRLIRKKYVLCTHCWKKIDEEYLKQCNIKIYDPEEFKRKD